MARKREPLTEKEVIGAVEDLFPGVDVTVESAPRASASDPRLAPYIARIVKANGIDDAFVTDESWMCDFRDDGEREAWRARVAARIGLDFRPGDRVIDVAWRLFVKDKGN
jgi:hypothetical protein